jgi:hypothetical protein
MVRATHLPFMEMAMSNKVRDASGKFAPKSEASRFIRSVNLTDQAWQWLVTTVKSQPLRLWKRQNLNLSVYGNGTTRYINRCR